VSLGSHCLSFQLPSRDLFRCFLEQLGLGWVDRALGIGRRCSPAKAGKPSAGFLQTEEELSLHQDLPSIMPHSYKNELVQSIM
jgi:hypothetical protein